MPPRSQRLADAIARFKLDLVANPGMRLIEFCHARWKTYGYTTHVAMYHSLMRHFPDRMGTYKDEYVEPVVRPGQRRKRLLERYGVRA